MVQQQANNYQSTINSLNQQNSSLSSQLTTAQNNYQTEQTARQVVQQDLQTRTNVINNAQTSLGIANLNNLPNTGGRNLQTLINDSNNLVNIQTELNTANATITNIQTILGVNINNLNTIMPAGQNLNTLIADANNLPLQTVRANNLQTQLNVLQGQLTQVQNNYQNIVINLATANVRINRQNRQIGI